MIILSKETQIIHLTTKGYLKITANLLGRITKSRIRLQTRLKKKKALFMINTGNPEYIFNTNTYLKITERSVEANHRDKDYT